MESNKKNNDEYRVLKIPFASKKFINEFSGGKDLKNLYSYTGIAYYVFDKNLNIIHNTAKVTNIKNINDKITNAKFYILDEEIKSEKESIFNTPNPKILDVNSYIERNQNPALGVVSLLTNSHSTGAAFGRGFSKTQILYFDYYSPYNGWRFASALSRGKSIDTKTKKNYKYSKVFNNTIFFTFSELDAMNKIGIQELIIESEELERLFVIYNQDMIFDKDLLRHYSKEIDYLIEMNKYPKGKKRDELIGSLIYNSPSNKDAEENIIQNLTSIYRRDFRNKMLKSYIDDSIKYENILKEHEIEKVCEAAHFLDVKFIIREIKNLEINNKNDLKRVVALIRQISDVENGIFMDPTTHKYFDKDLLIIKSNGKIVDKTKTNKYKDINLQLSNGQKRYLIYRNEKRSNI